MHAKSQWAHRTWAAMFCLTVLTPPARAHEFWIDVIDYTPKVGASVPLVFRIGQNFQGGTYPFVRKLSKRFSVVDARGDKPIKTIDGDDPAAEVKFATPGLSIVVTQRAPERVDFETMAKFDEYLDFEGLEPAKAEHRRLGLPEKNIRELFARCAKALVMVGPVGGADRAVGLPLEIVAEQNPYALKLGESLTVRVLHLGQPMPGLLLKSFTRDDAQSPRLVRTDADGRATVALPVAGEYLLSAVHIAPAQSNDKADWSSLWASLTFKRP